MPGPVPPRAAEPVEKVLQAARVSLERSRCALADAQYRLGVIQAEGRKTRARVDRLLANARAEIAALRDAKILS